MKLYIYIFIYACSLFLFSCSPRDKESPGAVSDYLNIPVMIGAGDHPFLNFKIIIEEISFVNENHEVISIPVSRLSNPVNVIPESLPYKIADVDLPLGKYIGIKFQLDMRYVQLQLLNPELDATKKVMDVALADDSGRSIPGQRSIFTIDINHSFTVSSKADPGLEIYLDTYLSMPFLEIDIQNPVLTFTPIFRLYEVDVMSDIRSDDSDMMQVDKTKDKPTKTTTTKSDNTAKEIKKDNDTAPNTPEDDLDESEVESEPDAIEDEVEIEIEGSHVIITATDPENNTITVQQDNESKVIDIQSLSLMNEDKIAVKQKDLHAGQKVILSAEALTAKRSRFLARIVSSDVEKGTHKVAPVLINDLKPEAVFVDANNLPVIENIQYYKNEASVDGSAADAKVADSLADPTFFDDSTHDLLIAFYGYVKSDENYFEAHHREFVNILDTEIHIDVSQQKELTINYVIEGDGLLLQLDNSKETFPVIYKVSDESIVFDYSINTIRLPAKMQLNLVDSVNEEAQSYQFTESIIMVKEIQDRLAKDLVIERIKVKGTPLDTEFLAKELTIIFTDKVMPSITTQVIKEVDETESESSLSSASKLGIGIGISAFVLSTALFYKMIPKLVNKINAKVDGSSVPQNRSGFFLEAYEDESLKNLKKHNPSVYALLSDSIQEYNNRFVVDDSENRGVVKGLSEYINKEYSGLLSSNDKELASNFKADLFYRAYYDDEFAEYSDFDRSKLPPSDINIDEIFLHNFYESVDALDRKKYDTESIYISRLTDAEVEEIRVRSADNALRINPAFFDAPKVDTSQRSSGFWKKLFRRK